MFVLNAIIFINFYPLELQCDPLVVEDQFLLVSCPNGYSYGSICDFSCFLSYKLIGTDHVACEKDPGDEEKAIWKWSNNTETFCDKLGKSLRIVLQIDI